MKKPTPPEHPEPGNPIETDDVQIRRLKDLQDVHVECARIGSSAIQVKIVRGEWTGRKQKIAEEWLIYYRHKADRWNRFWMITGGVSAVAAAIFGVIAIF